MSLFLIVQRPWRASCHGGLPQKLETIDRREGQHDATQVGAQECGQTMWSCFAVEMQT